MAQVDTPQRDSFGPHLLRDVVEAVLARAGAQEWQSRISGMWHRLAPPGARDRVQGWKLHISATPLSAPLVLAQAVPVLLEQSCAFKFAATLNGVVEMTDGRCERGQGGKFLTAYPCDDEQFRTLAEALDHATRGLPGPPVLSDRPYRPGSLVSYRFGAFRGVEVLTDDGAIEVRLQGPEGETQKDQRDARYAPPAWAVPPLPTPTRRSADDHRDGSSKPLISGRFAVKGAIRHAYRGGVFLAMDQETGSDVVLKQARPHVGSWVTGSDVRDSLRHEAEMLARLPRVAPRPVGLFTHQDNLFLAEEFIPGQTLRSWAQGQRAANGNLGPSLPELATLVRGLVDLLAAVHGEGLVCRDFNPNNVMVTPEGSLRLVDLEHVTVPGTQVRRAVTLGYAAPEQVRGSSLQYAPGMSADLYSLGAIVFHLATGTDPLLLADRPENRPTGPRLSVLLDAAGPCKLAKSAEPSVVHFADLVAGLTSENPDDRWSLEQVREFLAETPEQGPEPPRATVAGTSAGREELLTRALGDGLDHLLRTMTPEAKRLWPDTGFSATTDPCNVQHGAAGVLGVLVRAAATPGSGVTMDAVRGVADWIVERLPVLPRILPGLFFGRAGTAWALHSASRLLDDAVLERRALDLALSLPVTWSNPDVCHGLAGAGLALVHLWRATGDAAIEEQAHACADGVLKAASRDSRGLLWEIPPSLDSVLAGTSGYGFAHGVAGMGAFLLAMGCASGRADCLETAAEAGRILVEAMEPVGPSAVWPTQPGSSATNPMPWSWCNGTAGIGAFLIRLWRVTGDEPAFLAAERAGVAAHRDRRNPSGSVCHGAPGSGELLLDLAEATGESRYRDRATEVAACLMARHGIRDGRILVADESGGRYAPGYHTGLAGTLGFLLRLRDRGPRLWMPDGVLTQDQA